MLAGKRRVQSLRVNLNVVFTPFLSAERRRAREQIDAFNPGYVTGAPYILYPSSTSAMETKATQSRVARDQVAFFSVTHDSVHRTLCTIFDILP